MDHHRQAVEGRIDLDTAEDRRVSGEAAHLLRKPVRYLFSNGPGGGGAPWHLNRERFERDGVIVRSSNYSLYGDMSGRVMKILAGLLPS
jgi:hypothetical protein